MLYPNKNLSYCLLLLCTLQTAAKTYIVCTAALLETQASTRQSEYSHALTTIKNFGYDPYVIEACKQHGPTFLECYSDHVFYSTFNNPKLKNKGVNEAKTFLQGLKAFAFDDNDMIIKMTGRYYFTSDYLMRVIENNPTQDAFVFFINNAMLTVCFAMRYKELLTMLENLNYQKMESQMINIEWECAEYIRNNNHLQVLYLDKLDVQGIPFGHGITPIQDIPLLKW